jgi:hypothetical protein
MPRYLFLDVWPARMAYAKRMLYTDQDEVLIYAVRPTALTSVVEVIEAPDLGDRTITIVPPRIEENEEAAVIADFENKRPAILAAFLDAVAHGIKTLPDIAETKWPRMADFAKWVTACEGAYDQAATFSVAYRENRSSAVNALLSENVVGSAVIRLPLPWQGQIGATRRGSGQKQRMAGIAARTRCGLAAADAVPA